MLFLFRCGHKSKTHSSFLHSLLQVIFFIAKLEEKIEHFFFCHFHKSIDSIQNVLKEFSHVLFCLCRKSERMFFLSNINRQSFKLYVCLNFSCGTFLVLLLVIDYLRIMCLIKIAYERSKQIYWCCSCSVAGIN